MSSYKWCFVPKCTNTSVKNPTKLFFTVPKTDKQRKKWFKAARRDINVSQKSTLYCCEDHFHLEEDMENYMRYKMVGGHKKIKVNVVPHVFCCQEDRLQRTALKPLRLAQMKRTRLRIVGEAVNAYESIVPAICSNEPQEHGPIYAEMDTQDLQSSVSTNDDLLQVVSECTTTKQFATASVQTHFSYRSKSTQCKLPENKVIITTTSPVKQTRHVMTSPIKTNNKKTSEEKYNPLIISDSDEMSESGDQGTRSDSEYKPSPSDSDSPIDTNNHFIEFSISRKPKMYTGIPDRWYYHLLPLLMKYTCLSERDIKLTLIKIKTNDSFERLGDQFGMSFSNASRIFNRTVPVLAHMLKQLIYWPERSEIKKKLPLPFRYKYHNVQSIIDCLEIQIEKPGDPIMQALTWSDYKSCNTLKFLVSSTPDGLINFISEGFGGRISDSLLLEESGYLEKLPAGAAVMADRGFRHISQLLANKGCQLVKPPSVSSKEKPSKNDVLETKRIASLRIHVERVIRRIREFEFLKPHAVIPNKLIASTNDVISVACGLVNLQSPIIKQ